METTNINAPLILRKSEQIEAMSGILVLNGYDVKRVKIKDPDNKGYFEGILVTGNGILPKVPKGSKEDEDE